MPSITFCETRHSKRPTTMMGLLTRGIRVTRGIRPLCPLSSTGLCLTVHARIRLAWRRIPIVPGLLEQSAIELDARGSPTSGTTSSLVPYVAVAAFYQRKLPRMG